MEFKLEIIVNGKIKKNKKRKIKMNKIDKKIKKQF
ncbi:hypothetical protein X274_02030 [Marinitoga sp. 1155]|nr:hypothetical protein X274_02030 [Marinitoga sp. 1155]